jgi:3-phenylpropionate/cinnamic acid dioxygenase small subunit
MDDPALQALLDRAAIHDLLLRYARGVDRRDLALVASCFTPDCAYEGALGRGSIGDALALLEVAMGRYERTLHFVGNQLVELDGDRARSETYAVAYHGLPGGRLYVTAVRYLDELVRHDGGWRIARRTVTREWERTEEHHG